MPKSEDIDSVTIMNEDEFLQHLYNRYHRIYVDTLAETVELLRVCTTKASAMAILRNRIAFRLQKVTDNVAEQNHIWNKISKRGNPRERSEVGL